MQTLSNNSIQTFQTCPRKYYYTYVVERVPSFDSNKTAAEFGTAFHLAVELYLQGTEIKEAIKQAIGYFEPFEDKADAKRTSFKLHELLTEYFNYYSLDGFTAIPQKVENTFNLPLGDITYNGRFDAIGLINGIIVGRDTKTTSMPYAFQSNPNAQLTGYCWAGRQIVEGFAGIMLDIVGVFKNKPERLKNNSGWKTGASPADIFFRYLVERNDEEIAEWQTETLYLAEIIKGCESSGIWRMQSTGCTSFGSQCPYINVCRAPKKIREELLYSSMFIDRNLERR